MIYENDLRDDQGELFGFGSHLFRHTYGVKLTELHVDDWTISKLIGHKNVKTVIGRSCRYPNIQETLSMASSVNIIKLPSETVNETVADGSMYRYLIRYLRESQGV